MLYLTIIIICGLLLTVLTSLILEFTLYECLFFSFISIITVVIIDALTATIARLLPARFAKYEQRIFRVSIKEKRFYEKIKIKKWKDKVPEIGHFTGFRKNKILQPKSIEYLERFLLEICYGEIGHALSCLTGFLILLLAFLKIEWIAFTVPVAIINMLLNLPSLFILRYNSYKLVILLKRNSKNQS